MEYYRAKDLAKKLLNDLGPHCDKIEISGEIAQKKTKIEQIEIVAIPKFYDTGLFKTGIAAVLDKLEYIDGMLPKFKVVRKVNDDINLYFYSCNHNNYGFILGWCNSPDTFRNTLKCKWNEKGYKGNKERHLTHNGAIVKIPDEHSFFNRIGLPYVAPEDR